MIIIGPLWFLNLILVALNMILIIFFGVTNNVIKVDYSIKNIITEKAVLPKSDLPSLNDITDRDIFNTKMPIQDGTKIFVFQPKDLVRIVFPPNEPEVVPISNTIIIEKEVLPPLQVILHGTIISDHPISNKAFIENIRTKEEKEYIIGDIIEDAQLVYIGKHKASLIRSNGQEESIYLNKLLKIEEEAILNTPWNKVIIENSEQIKIINFDLFNYKVKSLNAFINQLNLITIFEKSIPIGCLIQNAAEGTLGKAMGFEKNDIIISVNNIPVNYTDSRMEIYNLIMNNKNNEKFLISVNLKREGQDVTLLFALKIKNDTKSSEKKMSIIKTSNNFLNENL